MNHLAPEGRNPTSFAAGTLCQCEERKENLGCLAWLFPNKARGAFLYIQTGSSSRPVLNLVTAYYDTVLDQGEQLQGPCGLGSLMITPFPDTEGRGRVSSSLFRTEGRGSTGLQKVGCCHLSRGAGCPPTLQCHVYTDVRQTGGGPWM